jgi:oligosaccharide repeat unit polymerase
MNWTSIICFGIAFLICGSMLRRDADILSPARIFGFVWSIVFGLANLKLSRLQLNWSLTQWGYVLLGPVSLLFGLFVVQMFHIGSQVLPIARMRQVLREERINHARLFYLIVFAFVTYLAGYLAIYLVKGYIPLFTFRPSTARIEYFVFGVGLFIHHMPIIVFFTIVYHLLTRDSRWKKRILKLAAFVTVLTFLFLLQRYELIMIFLLMLTLLYYATRVVRFRTALLFTVIGVLIIYSVSTLRAGQILQLVLYKTSQMKFSYEYAIFTEPYMYIVMNVENFVRAVGMLNHHTFGFFTFDFVLALTGLKHWLQEYFTIPDVPFQISGYNTHTLFWPFYRDFGVIGISLLPFLGGVGVGSFYHAMRRNPTMERVSFYGIIVFVMALSFFISPLGYLYFVYILAWMFFVFRLIRVKGSQSDAHPPRSPHPPVSVADGSTR